MTRADIILGFLATPILGLLFYALIRSFNPSWSFDNSIFYLPAAVLDVEGFRDSYLMPFVRLKGGVVLAHQSKPFFVLFTRVWARTWKFYVDAGPQPSPVCWNAMIAWTAALMVYGTYMLGCTLGRRRLALAAALGLAINPWMALLLFYGAYTQLSIFFLTVIVILLLHQKKWMVVAAGILAGVTLLTNQSTSVFLAGIGILPLLRCGSEWKRGLLETILFGVSCAAFLVSLEVLIPLAFSDLASSPDGPLYTLVSYLQRSTYANAFGRKEIPKYPFMMFRMMSETTPLLKWVLVASLLYMLGHASSWLRDIRGQPARLVLYVLLLPAVVGVFIIDFRDGVQFGRSYLISMPFVFLFLSYFAEYFYRNAGHLNLSRQTVPVIYVALFSFLLIESGAGMFHLHTVFHQAASEIRRMKAEGLQLAVIEEDPFARRLLKLGSANLQDPTRYDTISAIHHHPFNRIPETTDRLLVGPAVNAGVFYTRTSDSDDASHTERLLKAMSRQGWIVSERLPLWVAYAPLIFEDEIVTWKWLSSVDPEEENEGACVFVLSRRQASAMRH